MVSDRGGGAGDGEAFDAAYYKSRVARLEEKVAKEQQKVKSTVKYYEEQFEVQAKKLAEMHEEETKAMSEELVQLRAQLDSLQPTQEALKGERAAREALEEEVAALRDKVKHPGKATPNTKTEEEIAALKNSVEEALKRADEAEQRAKSAEERVKSAPPPHSTEASDPAQIKLLHAQLDEEREQRELSESKLRAAELELVDVRGELEQANADLQEAEQVKARLDVTEKLMLELKVRSRRMEDLERQSEDWAKDKDHLRQAYDKIQELTNKLIALTNEKEVLVRNSIEQAHVERVEEQLEQTRSELARVKNEAHVAQVDRSNSEQNFRFIIDDVARVLREYAMISVRWEGRMVNEITEANEQHAEVRRQTMNLISAAEADAQRVLRESITAVNDARHALAENHRRNEDIIEDAIRLERLRMSDETKTMKSELVEAERRAINANAQIDDLSEQLRKMRIDLHLARDAHAALAAISSGAPSVIDTAHEYGSDGGAHSPSGEKVEDIRKKLRLTQFELLAHKAYQKFQLEPAFKELEDKLQFMREEREMESESKVRSTAPVGTSEDAVALHCEVEWLQAKIERLETEKKGKTPMSASPREKELEEALVHARSELEASEKTLQTLRKEQMHALEEAAEDMESHLRTKLTEMREEVMLAQAQREKSRNELHRTQDELVIARSERDDAIAKVQSTRDEMAELRQAITDMTESRSEIITAGKEEVRLREDELKSVRKELANVRAQKDDALSANNDLKNRLVDAEARLSEAEERKRASESELGEASKSVNERNKMESKLFALQAERDEMQTKLDEVVSSRKELEDEVRTLLKKMNESQEESMVTVAKTHSELLIANQTISSLREELQKVEAQLTAKNGAYDRAIADREIAGKTLDEAREALGACEVELKLAEKALAEKEREHQALSESFNEAKRAHDDTKKELEKVEAELVNLVEVVEQNENSIEKTKAQLAEKTKALEDVEARIRNESTRVGSVEAERDVASESLTEARRSLAEAQAEAQLAKNEILDLRVQRDRFAQDYEETLNELKLTEGYLQKASSAVEKHRAERDGLSRALEEANDKLSQTEIQMQAMSAQLAELHKEIEGYRDGERPQVQELEETRHALDAVIDKFKTLRDSHEELLVSFDEQVDARALEQREHERVLENLQEQHEERLAVLQSALRSKSDQGALLSELLTILDDVTSASKDAQLAGDETEARTALQHTNKPAPPPNTEAYEALLRIKSALDEHKSAIRAMDGPNDDVAKEVRRSSLRIRIVFLDILINLVSQRSRVGEFKGRLEIATRPETSDTQAVRDADGGKKRGGIRLFGLGR